jgi:hypothetical protein
MNYGRCSHGLNTIYSEEENGVRSYLISFFNAGKMEKHLEQLCEGLDGLMRGEITRRVGR